MIKTLLASLVLTCFATLVRGAETPDYRRDVEPIFQQYCTGCHSSADREGKLSLEQFSELLGGGAGGVVVVPGRAELSRLVLVLEGREKPAMPPEGNEGPTAAEIATLKRWIDAGAKGPTGQAPDPTVLVTPQIKLTAPARDPVTALAVSPTKDGLAAVGAYRSVRLVTLDDQTPLRTLSGVRGSVSDLAFSHDGKLLASASGEPGVFGEAQLWNVADGKLLHTFTGHRDSLYAVAVGPDSKLLATGSYDQTIKLWDAATGKELRTLTGHNGAVFDLAFSPNGKFLASAGADRTIKLWNVADGVRLATLGQPTKEQYAVAFSPDGKTLVAGGVDNRLRVWRISKTAAENTNPLVITRFAHEGPIIELAFAADGKSLVSTGEDRFVRIWKASDVSELTALERQPDWVGGLAFSADGKQVVLGRMDGSTAVYDAATGKLVPPPAPEIVSIAPRGVRRGEPTVVTLAGKHLAGVANVMVRDAAGKPVQAMFKLLDEGRTSTMLRAELIADASLPRGSYQVVASSPSGTSLPQTLQIDDLPQLVEMEPNDSLAKVEATPLEAGYWGVCSQPGDVDHYRFAAKKGETIVCQLEAKSLGSMINGVLSVLTPDGEVAAVNNDFDGGPDALTAYRVRKDGLYTVRVNDQTMGGSANHFYRLTVGTFPLVTGVFPMNVTLGREANVELTGFNLPAKATVAVKPEKPGPTPVAVDAEKYRVLTPPRVWGASWPEIVEREPNDVAEKAQPVALPASVNGRIYAKGANPGADVDLFRFESQAGQSWIIETEARRRSSPIDTKIDVLDAQGNPVPRLLLQAVRDTYITFRSISSTDDEARLFAWEEMELNQYLYMSGEVCKFFRKPKGPDSGFQFYLSAGKRRDYFDTSTSGHALDEPAYIVEPRPIGTKLINTGLPVYTLYYANDDDGLRKLGSDSRLTFTAPAAGAYLVRVADVRGFGGDHFNYRLTIREPRPDFKVQLMNAGPTVGRGSGGGLTFNADRIDGFDDEIMIDVAGLPAGYSASTPTSIEAGHDAAQIVLTAADDAKPVAAETWAKVKITARGKIAEAVVEREVNGLTKVTLDEPTQVGVTLEPAELTIAPGTTVPATLKIERRNFNDRVAFDVSNLPHGVIVDDIGLSGILIPEGQTERQIFLTCSEWVEELDRPFFAQTKTVRAGGVKIEAAASRPSLLKVRKPATLVQADDRGPEAKPIPAAGPK